MAWLAVNKNGDEIISLSKPYRTCSSSGYYGDPKVRWEDRDWCGCNYIIPLPKGSINKLIGHDMAWMDEPIELKNKNV